MAEGFLSDAGTVTVAASAGEDLAAFSEVLDALAHVALASDDRALSLPVADPASWLWYFTAPAVPVVFDAPALEAVAYRLNVARQRVDGLALSPDQQAIWPATLGGPAALALVRPLTASQSRNVARLLRLHGGANFSVPGAGKTAMAYATYRGMRLQGEVDQMLVLAPLSAHEAWVEEAAAMFALADRPQVAVGAPRGDADVVVVNYERLESPGRLDRIVGFCQARRTLVVFDEAHRVKAGPSRVRGAAAKRVAAIAARRSALTGTPQPNSPDDLAWVLDLVYPGEGHRLARLDPDRLMSAYCRATKDELGLPQLRTVVENIVLSGAHERVYAALTDAATRAVLADPSLRADLTRIGRIVMLLLQAVSDPTAILDAGGDLAMLADHAGDDLGALIAQLGDRFVPTKFVRVAQLVDARHAAGDKVLVWASFRHHIDRLATLLAPHAPAVVHGGVVGAARHSEIDRFRHDPACHVLVATPHTLSEGISLHHTTTHQVHLDRTFNAGMLLQAIDRTHRLGLPAGADCSVTYLQAVRRDGAETLDGVVAGRLEVKIAAMARTLNDAHLSRLALPDADDVLTDVDVLLGPDQGDDLAALFAHLRGA